jgi:Flp pilus assembly pilin Flp
MKKYFSSRKGQGMVEYVLIVALVAVVCVAGFKVFGKQIRQLFIGSSNKIQTETKNFNTYNN